MPPDDSDPAQQAFKDPYVFDFLDLAKHGYPPDQQPAAIKLVMEQMESMAPRYAQRREAS